MHTIPDSHTHTIYAHTLSPNGADLCVNEGQKLSEYRVSLAEEERKKEEEGEKSIFDCVWFSRKTAVLDSRTMSSGSISRVDNDGET